MSLSTGMVRRPALVAVAHGSRIARAADRTGAAPAVRARRPGLDVRLGHIELNEPLLSETLAGLRARWWSSAAARRGTT